MTYISALLPVAHGVAVYAALTKHAKSAKATGDPHSHGQLMADEFVARVTTPGASHVAGTAATGSATDLPPAAGTHPNGKTGSADTNDRRGSHSTGETSDTAATFDQTDESADRTAVPEIPAGVNLDIQLVMTDRSLFDGDNEPAHLIGYGPIPAALARKLVRDGSPQTKAWIRRLYTDPDTGHLITGDTRRRGFNYGQRQFLIARDQTCRTAYCDAPIRQTDHVTGHAINGVTDVRDGQGLCENCNYLKTSPGWHSRVDPNGHTITTTTPTGHTHHSNPPPPPRSEPWDESRTVAPPGMPHIDWIYPEQRFRRHFYVA